MLFYIIYATFTHHTTDREGVSVDVVSKLPEFILDATKLKIKDCKHAEEIVRKIICPADLQYESVTINVTVQPTFITIG